MTEEFQTALIFQDRMVLQRDKNVSLWGTGPEGRTVSALIQGKETRTTVCEGVWRAVLPPLDTSESETLEISCGEKTILLKDVAVGEVWIAGGQSNMEFFVRYDIEAEAVLKKAENRNIRFFDFPEISYPGQIRERDYSRYGLWRHCTPGQLEYFSAVGYHFADHLHAELDVPVGIVGCNWGGTPACAWMATGYMEENEGRIWLDDYERGIENLDPVRYRDEFTSDPGNYRDNIFSDETGEKLMFGMTREEQKAHMETPGFLDEKIIGPLDKCRPGGLFESMVREVAPYTARGILWYQGESDDKHPEIYRVLLSSLIRCWRETWGEDLPFLMVQLAPFREWLHCTGAAYPVLREQQEWVARHVPDTWLACIMDSGEEWDIHPRNKQPVGTRLALLAEGRVYNRDILCESPLLERYELVPGCLSLSFLHAGEGLHISGDTGEINDLELGIGGRDVTDYRFEIKGPELLLIHEALQPGCSLDLRFARKDFCKVNLYNPAGLPVRPFALNTDTPD